MGNMVIRKHAGMKTAIDMEATGANIVRLQQLNGFRVKDLQSVFGFKTPQAIYKWRQGKCIPNLDNLVTLSDVFNVPIDDIIVRRQIGGKVA